MRSLLSIAFMLVLGVAAAQGTISGTVFAPEGGDVYGTYVIACHPDSNQDCDESLIAHVQIGQGGASAPFELRNLAAVEYAVLAWQDSNGNGEIDDGEPVTFHTAGGSEPTLLLPPAQGLELRFAAAAAQPDKASLEALPGPETAPAASASSISGTVTAPPGGDVAGSFVLVCVLLGEECDEAQPSEIIQIAESGGSASFAAEGLAAGAYAVFAWKDMNGSGNIDDGDYVGIYAEDGVNPSTVSPPAQGLEIAMTVSGEADSTAVEGAVVGSPAVENPAAASPAVESPAAAPPEVTFAHDPVEPGVVKGLVLDTYGQPIAGARVEIRNAVNTYASNIVISTDADGRYRFDLTPGGAWNVYAHHEVTYNDWLYCLKLAPQVWDAFSSSTGAVRNFSMKISGPGRYNDGSGSWGGRVDVEAEFNLRPDVNGSDTLRFTLVPEGPLLDGSTGHTIQGALTEKRQTMRPAINQDFLSNFSLHDIPLGRYLLSVDYVEADGSLSPMWVRFGYAGDYARAVVLDFQDGLDCGSTPYAKVSVLYSE